MRKERNDWVASASERETVRQKGKWEVGRQTSLALYTNTIDFSWNTERKRDMTALHGIGGGDRYLLPKNVHMYRYHDMTTAPLNSLNTTIAVPPPPQHGNPPTCFASAMYL